MRASLIMFVAAVLLLGGISPSRAQDAPEGQVAWQRLNVGTSGPAYFLLIKPETIKPSRHYPLLIFLHERGDTAGSVLKAHPKLFRDQDFYILIPQAPHRHHGGFSWADPKAYDSNSPEGFEQSQSVLIALLQALQKSHKLDPNKVSLTGFGEGGALAVHVGLRNPELFAKLMPIGARYTDDPKDIRGDDIRTLKVRILHGLQDEQNPYTDAAVFYDMLKQKKLDVKLWDFPIGHTYTIDMLGKVMREVN